MKLRTILTIITLGLLAGNARADWGRGLGQEHKVNTIPCNQQSGWACWDDESADAIDSDQDGVTDENDACAGTARGIQVDANGCPQSAKAVPTDNWTLAGVQFETGSDKLMDSSKATLDEAAEILNTHTRVAVEIQGHTDNVGEPSTNRRLSEKRAEAVKAYLVGKGVSSNRLSARGFGETAPVADNATEEGRAQNRRIQFKVIRR